MRKVIDYNKIWTELDVSHLIRTNKREIDRDNTKVVLYNLVAFCYNKNLLLVYPFNSSDNLKEDLKIQTNNLSPKGKILFHSLRDKWLGYTDNEDGKIDRKSNIKMLDKYYNKLVSECQEELGKVALWQSLYEGMLKEPLLLSNP